MGHRLITALIVLNVMGFLACVALIAAAISNDDAMVLAQVTNSVFVSVRMFVLGAGVPTVAWGIAALEFDRSHTKKRSLASATMYALLIVSLILFCVAGWRLPRAFLDSLQIIVEFSDAPLL
jgi:hypothetical protein